MMLVKRIINEAKKSREVSSTLVICKTNSISFILSVSTPLSLDTILQCADHALVSQSTIYHNTVYLVHQRYRI